MQKITFLINSLSSGGAEKVLSVLANRLIEERYEVEIIFLEKNEFYALDNRIKKTYLSNFTGKESGIKKLLYLPIFAWKLKKYVNENHIGLVQSHIYRANYVNILSKLFGSKHNAQVVNVGVLSRYKNDGLMGKINLFLVKLLYPKANLIIWKSKGMMQDANNYFHFNNQQIVINNPYDLETIKKLSKDVCELELKKDKVYIVSVGRLIKLKRNQDLIKAIKNIANVEVLFLGDGDKKEDLIKLSNDLGIKDRIHFLGNVSNPFKYIAKCDIFVHTSETEGFPNVVVEAMACGLPIISSDCISGPREILAPNSNVNKQLKKEDSIELGEYGILFPAGDIKALADAINLLLRNKEKYKCYKQQSLKRCQDFSLEKIISKYKKVLFDE